MLDRKYRLDRRLGVGGTGTVYAAWHLNLDRPVAVKVLHPQFAAQERLVERFRTEAQLMGLIAHEHVVRVLDFRSTADGVPYIVMDLVEGETLRQRLRRGPLPVEAVLGIFAQLCGAVGQAHAQGVVHRDLKPDNLMLLGEEGHEVLKILDFGSSKLLDSTQPRSSGQFQGGTSYYMAPERIDSMAGGGPADHRVDIFALGAILYEMLSGRMAFPGEMPVEAVFKILSGPPPPLGLADPRAPLLDQVVQRACSREVAERYPSAEALWRALAAAARGETPPVEPGPAPTAESAAGTETADGPASWADTVPQHALPSAVQHAQEAAASAVAQAETPRPAPRTSTPSRAPLVPRVLSAGRPLGLGVKQAVLQSLAEQAEAEVGGPALERAMGPGWLPRLRRLVATDMVDAAELAGLLRCVADAGGDEALLRLGRAFADGALTTIYASFVRQGPPAASLRRLQTMLRLWFTEGEGEVREAGAGAWLVQVRGLRLLAEAPELGVMLAGFLQRYLEMTGAGAVQVRGPAAGAEAGSGEFLVQAAAQEVGP